MTTMSATTFARQLSQVLDRLEHGGKEIAIIRNQRMVAKLVPGVPRMNALEAFADLYGILTPAEGAAWARDAASLDRKAAAELENPWES